MAGIVPSTDPPLSGHKKQSDAEEIRPAPCARCVSMRIMPNSFSRRHVLKRLGVAGAGVAFSGGVLRGQTRSITIAGKPVEIAVASVSPSTVRITVLPIGARRRCRTTARWSTAAAGKALGRGAGRRSRWRRSVPAISPCASPPSRRRFTSTRHPGKPVQRLTLDAAAPTISFLMGKGPLLGLGEGGPQFDRKGTIDRGRNGQGGYQLRTHGGRVPIQWLVGTDGWGMFIHQPLGAFDFTGAEAQAHAGGRGAAARRVRYRLGRSQGHHGRVRADHRPRGTAGALDVRLHAVASHAVRARRDHEGRADVPREAAAVRRAHLSRHRVHAVGMEHAQRRVRLEEGELPGAEEGDRRSARAALQGRAARRDRRPPDERSGERSLHAGQGGAERTHAGRPVAGGSRGPVLLAVSQAGVRPRRRRLVAGSGRRPRRAVAAGADPHVLGRAAALASRTSGRSRCTATALRACSATARFCGRATCIRPGRR